MAYAPHGSRKDRNEDAGTNFSPPTGSCGGAYAIRPYRLSAGEVFSNKFSERKDRNKDTEKKKAIDKQWRRMAYAPHGSRKDRNEDAGTNFLPSSGLCGGAYTIRPYILPARDVVSNKFSRRKDRNEDAGKKKAIDR